MPSPVPGKKMASSASSGNSGLGFGEAMQMMADGKSMRKASWPQEDRVEFRANLGHIFRNGEWHRWVLCPEDITLEDDWQEF